jgi:hypothetical protein
MVEHFTRNLNSNLCLELNINRTWIIVIVFDYDKTSITNNNRVLWHCSSNCLESQNHPVWTPCTGGLLRKRRWASAVLKPLQISIHVVVFCHMDSPSAKLFHEPTLYENSADSWETLNLSDEYNQNIFCNLTSTSTMFIKHKDQFHQAL